MSDGWRSGDATFFVFFSSRTGGTSPAFVDVLEADELFDARGLAGLGQRIVAGRVAVHPFALGALIATVLDLLDFLALEGGHGHALHAEGEVA